MTDQISLDGRIAIVTGAGRGLGRAHALLLAERGAAVLVNDLGTDLDGTSDDDTPAREVVEEIHTRGGRAAADRSDVSTPDGARAMIERALEEFGRVDILVNNAGVHLDRPFPSTSFADFERLWRVNVGGHINTTHAVWPLMVERGYGRIVCTESAAGMYGLPGQTAYAATKGAVHGLMRSLALEGAPRGVLVNAIAPGAYTRMMEAGVPDPAMREQMRATMPAELVSPVVAWLASERCTSAGEVFTVWGGRVARVALGAHLGHVNPALTPEDLVEHADAVNAPGLSHEPLHAFDEVQHWSAAVFSA
ncbi:MAG TPA: SDR family NAD(P)-dependent oxidoreductase [Pseudonocardia sp.]|jgi:NAD(P)-dependent dehydrogenase (short-subunit alcohol dehydrogenase family)